MVVAVLGVLVISVTGLVLYHIEARDTKPHDHIDSRNTDQNVQQSFYPRHTEGDPVYKIETENTDQKPVDCTYNCQDKRNHRKNVESLFQIAFPPC